MSQLSGRVAWVTGGARGIGAAIVDRLRGQGADVWVTDRHAAPGVEACDQRDPLALARFAQTLGERTGRLDILVNSAGVQIRRTFVDFTPEDYAEIMGVNLRGVFFAAQSAARVMRDRCIQGSIINISSVNALHAQPETVLYCASKGGVYTMTRALAVALGPYGIRVNAVAPGTIATDLNRDRLSDPGTVEQVVGQSALGRLGTPGDVAQVVSFLAGDDARFVTGESIAVHGGWTLQG